MPIPRTDNELMVWLNNFVPAFGAHILELGGFVEDDMISVDNDAKMLRYLVGEVVPTYKSALRARSTYKDLIISGPLGSPGGAPPPAPVTQPPPTTVPPGILPRLRNLVQRIQLAPGYNETIGQALGIIGTEGGPSAPDSTPKPTLKARSNGPGTVQVDFSKEKFDGVLIESRRAGQNGWQSLGLDNYSPYIDDRPPVEAGKPEQREYRARYMLRDQAIGEWSDIVTATFIP